jgi:hypothetical protein
MGANHPIEFDTSDIDVPTIYANMVRIWHTGFEFAIDFGIQQPLEAGADDGDPVVYTHIARVRVPPGLLFDITRAFAQNQDAYEARFGKIPIPLPD